MNEKIKVIIVEDEQAWLLSLQMQIQALGFDVVATADNLATALQVINQTDFDIAILDIQIDQQNSGIALGHLIRHSLQKPFIFVTANTDQDTLEKVSPTKPAAYITKPANKNELYIAIQNALENFTEQKEAISTNLQQTPNAFFIKIGKKYAKVFWQDVVSLNAEPKYIQLQLNSSLGNCYIRSSLQNAINHIIPSTEKNNYIQINRSQFVNVQHIEELNGSLITTTNKLQLSVSDNYLSTLKAALNIML